MASKAQNLKKDFERFFALLGIVPSGNVFQDLNKVAGVDEKQIEKSFTSYFFQNYDRDNNGYIDKKEVEVLFKEISDVTGRAFEEQKWQAALEQVGAGNKENIDYNTFVEAFDKLDIDKQSATPATTTASTSSYSQRVIEEVLPVLKLLGVTPSGNLIRDLLAITQQTDLEKVLLDNLLAYFFLFYDKDGNGTIDSQEMEQLLLDMNNILPEEEQVDPETLKSQIGAFLEQLDVDKNGLIDLAEFKSFFSSAQ